MTNPRRMQMATAGLVTGPSDGQAWASGATNRLNATGSNISTPAQIGSLTTWGSSSSSYGYDHMSTVKSDGTLWTVGVGTHGRLGHGNTTTLSVHAQVGSLTDWSKPAGGGQMSCCIKTDGTLWSFGHNNLGQLGHGNTTNQSSPVQVGSATNWVSAAMGDAHFGAINTSGQLYTCGNADLGGTGHGDGAYTDSKSSLTQVGSLTNWAKIAMGDRWSIAVKTDGTLWSFGHNNRGQLGHGNTTNISSPVQVGSLTNWANVFPSSQTQSCIASKTDGTLWAMGKNFKGQLGIGTTSNVSSPVQIGSATNWVSAAIPNEAGSAINSDGDIFTWGNNAYGNLGHGNTTNLSAPTQIADFENCHSIGSMHTVLLIIV